MVKSILSSRDAFCLPVKPEEAGSVTASEDPVPHKAATLADGGSLTKHLADQNNTRVHFLSLNVLVRHPVLSLREAPEVHLYVLTCLLWMEVISLPLCVPSPLERNAEIHPWLGAPPCPCLPIP